MAHTRDQNCVEIHECLKPASFAQHTCNVFLDRLSAAHSGCTRALHLQGGFRGWARAGLDIQDGTATYKATVLDTLSDEAEAAVEATNSFLRYAVNSTALLPSPPSINMVIESLFLCCHSGAAQLPHSTIASLFQDMTYCMHSQGVV